MSSVVLGYPIINPANFEWIQSIRKTNDRLYKVVKPHFTFVFPTSKLSEDDLIITFSKSLKASTRSGLIFQKRLSLRMIPKLSFMYFWSLLKVMMISLRSMTCSTRTVYQASCVKIFRLFRMLGSLRTRANWRCRGWLTN